MSDKENKSVVLPEGVRIVDVHSARVAAEKRRNERIEANLKEIIIDNVSNCLASNPEAGVYTVKRDDVIEVSGLLDVEDTQFKMSLSHKGQIEDMYVVDVVDGTFVVKVKLEQSGQYKFTSENANLDLPEPLFRVKPITIDVVKVL